MEGGPENFGLLVCTRISCCPVVSAHISSTEDSFLQIVPLKQINRISFCISTEVRMHDAISWDPCGSGGEVELSIKDH